MWLRGFESQSNVEGNATKGGKEKSIRECSYTRLNAPSVAPVTSTTRDSGVHRWGIQGQHSAQSLRKKGQNYGWASEGFQSLHRRIRTRIFRSQTSLPRGLRSKNPGSDPAMQRPKTLRSPSIVFDPFSVKTGRCVVPEEQRTKGQVTLLGGGKGSVQALQESPKEGLLLVQVVVGG